MQSSVLYLWYIILILLFSSAYNTSLIYCLAISYSVSILTTEDPAPLRSRALQNMEQSQNTISKEWTQDHIHRRKMSTILFWMHLCIHSKIAILHQFLTSNVHFARKGCRGHLKIAILHQFLTFNIHFARKGCRGTSKSQFYISFWHLTSISCEKVATDTSKSQFYVRFWRPRPISREMAAAD